MLCVLLEILRNYESMLEVVLPSLPKSVEDDVTDRGKAAYIWILGEFGDVSVMVVCCHVTPS